MKDRDPKTLKSDEQVPKVQKSSESAQPHLTTVKMDPHSPIQDLLCRDEYQRLFESLWKKEHEA